MQLSVVEKKNSALARKASDACAEEEILQARISELTSENSTLEVAKCNLLKQIQTLAKEKETFETAKSELRELSEQRGRYCICVFAINGDVALECTTSKSES